MNTKEKFILEFGEEECNLLTKVALEHLNSSNPMSQLFTWVDYKGKDNISFEKVIATVISFQCVEVQEYRKYHGITLDYVKFQQFVRNNIIFHTDDLDAIWYLGGGYDSYVIEK